MWAVVVAVGVVLITIFVFVLMHKLKKMAPRKWPCRTMIILGSGGHTAEMLSIARAMDKTQYSPRIYVIGHTDTLSRKKVLQMEGKAKDFSIETIFRIREVGQSWISTVTVSAPRALLGSASILLRHKPKMLFSNGPGICVPFCVLTAFLRTMFLMDCNVVFVESVCRVQRLSLSGTILQYLVDDFVVQWPELIPNTKNALYFGGRVT